MRDGVWVQLGRERGLKETLLIVLEFLISWQERIQSNYTVRGSFFFSCPYPYFSILPQFEHACTHTLTLTPPKL